MQDFRVIQIPIFNKEKILALLDKVDAIIYRLFSSQFDREILEGAQQLKCIVRTGGGAGAIDFRIANDRGIVIMHTGGCNSVSGAEFIFAAIMDLARKISESNVIFRSGSYDRSTLWGNEFSGKTVGIVGFGKMGKYLSKMVKALGMNVISNSPNLSKDEEIEYGVRSVGLEELCKESDFISIAFPVKGENKGIFDKTMFDLMKPGVNLINITWMGLFHEHDLLSALKSGKIGGVMIERPSFDPKDGNHPLMEFPNVIFTPAVGSQTHEGQGRCGLEAANYVIDYLNHGKITNQISRS